jgi:DeoR-like helix-turn-helix domain
MTDHPIKALKQIRNLADSAIAAHESAEADVPAQTRKSLPRGAGKAYVEPLLSEFAPSAPFVTAEVLARFNKRYPMDKTSEQTVRRALNEFANEGLLDRVRTGWRIKTRLKAVNRGGA